MTQIKKEAIVTFSQQQMFDLVADIKSYPLFVPYCSGISVVEESEQGVVARLEVSKGSFAQSFTTKNTLVEPSSLTMELVDGPFKFLNGTWSFEALSDSASKIALDMEFEFSNKLLGLAFGKVFNQMVEQFVDAFTARAKQVYKDRSND